MLHTADDVLTRLNFIRNKRQEYFVCLSLDCSGKIIRRRTVTIGLINTALVHPREIFAGPLEDRATAIIVAHNHPSGDPSPSDADVKTTQNLAAAGIILGIPLDDHLIVSKNAVYSFRDAGLL